MQNDNEKCGMTEQHSGFFTESFTKDAYVWYEKNWQHDNHLHSHHRSQITYVEEGYQYFHINQQIYLVPQNHVIWIPSRQEHCTTSEAKTVNLMVVMFNTVPEKEFYQQVQVFAAPKVLKEMLLYVAKWNQLLTVDEEESIFLNAILNSLPNFCKECNMLKIPVPTDSRLESVCHYITSNYVKELNINELAERATMSVRSLQRIFKKETGISLQKYSQLVRILKSIELLDTRQYTLSQIGIMVGYRSLSAFTLSYFAIMKAKPKLKKQ